MYVKRGVELNLRVETVKKLFAAVLHSIINEIAPTVGKGELFAEIIIFPRMAPRLM